MGPILPPNAPRMIERQREAQYMLDKFWKIPQFDLEEVPQSIMIHRRSIRMVPGAVIGLLSVLKGCYTQNVFNDPASKEIGGSMIKEIYNVLRPEFKNLSLEMVVGWVTKHIELNMGVLHPMFFDAGLGKETDIDAINGVSNAPLRCVRTWPHWKLSSLITPIFSSTRFRTDIL